jgi:hypothetical protein
MRTLDTAAHTDKLRRCGGERKSERVREEREREMGRARDAAAHTNQLRRCGSEESLQAACCWLRVAAAARGRGGPRGATVAMLTSGILLYKSIHNTPVH